MDQVIRVKDANSIVLAVQGEETLEHPVHGKALALAGLAEPFVDDGAGLTGHLRRVVRTIVGHDVHIVQGPGIVQLAQVLDQLADDGVLVVGTGNQGEGFPLRELLDLFHFTEQPEPGNDEIVDGKEDDDKLQRYHDDIEYRAHASTSAFLLFSEQHDINRIDNPCDKVCEHADKGPAGRPEP